MRLDYALYVVAIILFILTGVVAIYAATQQLWVVTTAVLGFVCTGIGYWQRPHEQTTTQITTPKPVTTITPPASVITPPPPPTLTQEQVIEKAKTVEQIASVAQTQPSLSTLLNVKGIKEKRAQQLRAVGINTIEDLAKASPEDLASKLKIAPYFTGQWIENAKKIVTKS
jgi:predicted flap endonuclease-1-like 5' DNA nuclease